ncbi:hypothetical protein D3C72_2575030 [compost metagenome]
MRTTVCTSRPIGLVRVPTTDSRIMANSTRNASWIKKSVLRKASIRLAACL